MQRWTVLIVLAALAFVTPAWSQVDIKLTTNREYYLPYEPILMAIELKNNSGNPLAFKKWEDGYIACRITDMNQRQVKPFDHKLEKRPGNGHAGVRERINLASNLVLPAGGKQKSIVQLNTHYGMAKPGSYKIRLLFSHSRLPHDLLSVPVEVTVKKGEEVKTKKVGVPTAEGGKIKFRECTLIDFRAENTKIYCLRIQDEKLVHTLVRLSSHIEGDDPQMEVDARSQLHMLIHTEPRNFTHWVYSIDGKLKQMTQYEVVNDRKPLLHRDPDIGRVMILGGRRIIPGTTAGDELPNYKAPK